MASLLGAKMLSHYGLLQHSIVLQTDIPIAGDNDPWSVLPRVFSTFDFDFPYLGLNTTHISLSKKLVHVQIKRGRIGVSNHSRCFEIGVYGSREYDVKP